MSSRRSNSTKLHSQVFFTDRDSDGPFYRALVEADVAVERHDDHFHPGRIVEDHEWIELCARRGWVGVSSDRRMRHNPLALRAVIEHGARILVNVGSATHAEKGTNFVASLDKILRYLEATSPPFIARIYLRGRGVKTWFGAEDYRSSP